MLTDEQREHIITEAKEWIGTKYRGNTCIKGVGCDCGQFLFGVYAEAGFLPADTLLPKNYSLQIEHRNDTEYIDTVRRFARDIPESEVKPGDVVLYKFGKGFYHGCIVIEWPAFILHSLKREGVTGGHGMNHGFGKREKVFLTLRDEFCEGKK